MKTYPITDHVPESELTAITREGAERWLERHGWTREAENVHWWSRPEHGVVPIPCLWPSVSMLAQTVQMLACYCRLSPRQLIAEMQADTRAIEARRRMNERK